MGIRITIGKPFIKKDRIPSYEISSVIGLSGAVVGCVAISFSKQIALQLAVESINDVITTATNTEVGEPQDNNQPLIFPYDRVHGAQRP